MLKPTPVLVGTIGICALGLSLVAHSPVTGTQTSGTPPPAQAPATPTPAPQTPATGTSGRSNDPFFNADLAPKPAIVVHAAQDRPQPRLDVHHGRGMTVHVGRIRPCPILGYKLVALGHNVVRGAAGTALLIAELIVARGRSGARIAHADREPEAVASVGNVHTQQA